MDYGIDIVNLGDYADPRLGRPSDDPWIILAAVAHATTHIKIGTAVTSLPRRRPHVPANTIATLDLLSNGRVVFGVGLGVKALPPCTGLLDGTAGSWEGIINRVRWLPHTKR